MTPTDFDAAERLYDYATRPHTRREVVDVIADALASYRRAGQKAMRERAANKCDERAACSVLLTRADALAGAAAAIRALPVEG